MNIRELEVAVRETALRHPGKPVIIHLWRERQTQGQDLGEFSPALEHLVRRIDRQMDRSQAVLDVEAEWT